MSTLRFIDISLVDEADECAEFLEHGNGTQRPYVEVKLESCARQLQTILNRRDGTSREETVRSATDLISDVTSFATTKEIQTQISNAVLNLSDEPALQLTSTIDQKVFATAMLCRPVLMSL